MSGPARSPAAAPRRWRAHGAPGSAAALVLLAACGGGRAEPLPPAAPEHLVPAGALVAASLRSPVAFADALRASPRGRLLAELGRALLAGPAAGSEPLARAASVLADPTVLALYATGPEDGAEATAVLAARTDQDATALVLRIQAALAPPPTPATRPRELPAGQGATARFALHGPAGAALVAAAAPGALLLEHATRGSRIDEMIGLSSGRGRALGTSRIFADAAAALGGAPGARLFLDLQRAVELYEEAARRGGAGPGARAASAVRGGFDPRALESLVLGLEVGPDRIAAPWQLGLTGRGGIAALLDLERRALELPAVLPAPGPLASGVAIGRLNLVALLDSVERASADLALGGSVARGLLDAASGTLGVRIREDVLVRLSDEFALAVLPAREPDERRPAEAVAGRFALMAGVRDVPGLRARLDEAVRARGLHAAVRKVRKVAGGEIWQAELARVRFALAFGARFVGLAAGDGVTFLEACLAREAAPGADPERSFAGHAARLGIAAGEPVGLGSVDLAAVLEVVAEATGGSGRGALSAAARRLRELGIERVSGRAEQTQAGIRGRLEW